MIFGANGVWTVTQRDGSRRDLTDDEKTLVASLARELYDRFVMGGWEPQDAYAEIVKLIYE